MYFLYVWIGVLVSCAMSVDSTSMCYAAVRFLFAGVWSMECVCMDWFAFFGDIIRPASGQVPKLLICSWSVSFPFPWFSDGFVFSSCWLRFDVALYYCGLSHKTNSPQPRKICK
jgi:hypothetical protein